VSSAFRHLPTLHAVAGNAFWLIADKVVRLALGLAILAWVARYLGPEQYGTLSYAIAFVALFAAFSTLGIENIVVRELALRPEQRNELIGSALVLRLLGGLAGVALAVLGATLTRQGDRAFLVLVTILSAGAVLQAFDVIGHWFVSQERAKHAVVAKGAAFLAICATRIALIQAGAPLAAFAIAASAEVALAAAALAVAFQVNAGSCAQWLFRASVAWRLLRESWPMMFAFLAYTVYAPGMT
jgi:polysaccharide transporter, PST family